MSAWVDHVARWKDCQACPLGMQRFRICIARGTVPCDVLFIGEAPGASEDAIGQPFCGPAGTLLDQIIDRALPKGVTTAFTNLVCCFPREAKGRGDNEPEAAEIIACRPRLTEFIGIALPRLIVCVGSLAAQWIDCQNGVPVTHIIHPAATFPGRMSRAQASQAVQHAIVVLRCAIGDMLQSKRRLFTNEGKDANITSTRGRLSAQFETADAIRKTNRK